MSVLGDFLPDQHKELRFDLKGFEFCGPDLTTT